MHSILIVEDDTSINELLKEALEKENYRCTQAFSGTEARMLLQTNSYSVVLLDLMLPGIPGEEAYMGETKTLDVHISNIRKKIKEVTKKEYIETVWGIGYRLHP